MSVMLSKTVIYRIRCTRIGDFVRIYRTMFTSACDGHREPRESSETLLVDLCETSPEKRRKSVVIHQFRANPHACCEIL